MILCYSQNININVSNCKKINKNKNKITNNKFCHTNVNSLTVPIKFIFIKAYVSEKHKKKIQIVEIFYTFLIREEKLFSCYSQFSCFVCLFIRIIG